MKKEKMTNIDGRSHSAGGYRSYFSINNDYSNWLTLAILKPEFGYPSITNFKIIFIDKNDNDNTGSVTDIKIAIKKDYKIEFIKIYHNQFSLIADKIRVLQNKRTDEIILQYHKDSYNDMDIQISTDLKIWNLTIKEILSEELYDINEFILENGNIQNEKHYVKDDTTGNIYYFGIENGNVYLEEV